MKSRLLLTFVFAWTFVVSAWAANEKAHQICVDLMANNDPIGLLDKEAKKRGQGDYLSSLYGHYRPMPEVIQVAPSLNLANALTRPWILNSENEALRIATFILEKNGYDPVPAYDRQAGAYYLTIRVRPTTRENELRNFILAEEAKGIRAIFHPILNPPVKSQAVFSPFLKAIAVPTGAIVLQTARAVLAHEGDHSALYAGARQGIHTPMQGWIGGSPQAIPFLHPALKSYIGETGLLSHVPIEEAIAHASSLKKGGDDLSITAWESDGARVLAVWQLAASAVHGRAVAEATRFIVEDFLTMSRVQPDVLSRRTKNQSAYFYDRDSNFIYFPGLDHWDTPHLLTEALLAIRPIDRLYGELTEMFFPPALRDGHSPLDEKTRLLALREHWLALAGAKYLTLIAKVNELYALTRTHVPNVLSPR